MKIKKIFESDSTDILDKFTSACELIGKNILVLDMEFNHIDDLFLGIVEKYHLKTVETGSKESLSIGIQLVPENINDSTCFYREQWKTVRSEFVSELFNVMERIYNRYPIMSFRIYFGSDDIKTLHIRKSINDKKDEFYELKTIMMESFYFRTIMINISFDELLRNKFKSIYK